jgi:hypothetical protein
LPSPIVTTVVALKSCRSISEHGTSVPTHGLSGSTHSYHNHLSRRALLKHSRSRIPSPPRHLGFFTRSHLTKQWPPLAFSVPFRKKLLLILSIFLETHFLREKIVRKYVGIEESTEFISLSLASLFRKRPFHHGNRFPTLVNQACTCTLLRMQDCGCGCTRMPVSEPAFGHCHWRWSLKKTDLFSLTLLCPFPDLKKPELALGP